MRVVNIISALVLVAAPLLPAQDETASEIIARALQNPTNGQAIARAIWTFNKNFEPGLIPAFRELFQKVSDKQHRQHLAVSLMNHGQKDELYFNELARYAREAITTTAPLPFEYDKQGNEIKGQLTPAFKLWCETNGLELKVCLNKVADYPVDVMLLIAVEDPRAKPLLRQGLSATIHTTVEMAVKGLAELNDTESIPLIAANIQRFPPLLAESIAAAMADFDDPRIGPLLDRFVTDQKWREQINESIRKRRAQPRPRE